MTQILELTLLLKSLNSFSVAPKSSTCFDSVVVGISEVSRLFAPPPSGVCVAGGRALSAEDLQGVKGAGRLLSRGWERALCREEAERPPQGESSVTTVWRSALECPPSPAPSVLFLHNKADGETGSD